MLQLKLIVVNEPCNAHNMHRDNPSKIKLMRKNKDILDFEYSQFEGCNEKEQHIYSFSKLLQ
jgi:hypothetical protein